MPEINALEMVTLSAWALGVVAALWYFRLLRSLKSAVVLAVAVLLPVMGTLGLLKVWVCCTNR